MAAEDRVHDAVGPVIDDLGLELVDLVFGGGRLKITIDQPGGLDTEMLTRATRMISHELDLEDPINGTYTLEVSSPGVERPLRTPAHFARSIGEQVAIKLKPNDDNLRRVKGELTASDDDGITVATDEGDQRIEFDLIAKANTVFDWSPAPKPGKGKSGKNTSGKGKSGKGKSGKQKQNASSNKNEKEPTASGGPSQPKGTAS